MKKKICKKMKEIFLSIIKKIEKYSINDDGKNDINDNFLDLEFDYDP